MKTAVNKHRNSERPTLRRIRVGIDVGGTFTHAVAIDTQHFGLISQTKVHTTYCEKDGVALSIVTALKKLLLKGVIHPDEIILVAHSTTQATNALLEGDVAKVGIIGMGTGLKAIRVRRETNIENLELAPGKFLQKSFRFLDTANNFSEKTIRKTIQELKDDGAQAIVAAEAFSVDDPQHELLVVKVANEMGLAATASQQISKLYGLRIRTRTAVINASMLPVMIATAEKMETSLRKAGIKAPLMIMRSDGGIMDAKGMRERPILTMLSGPAAGIAAALMFARVADGIFLEVGGTSTDICVIHHGKVELRTARIGQHKLHLKTLDVRTVGVAGGSMPRIENDKITDVGPRSAHISGMPYESFSSLNELKSMEATTGSPTATDPGDYTFLQKKNRNYAITLTGAANFAGLIPTYDYAAGGEKNVRLAFEKLSSFWGKPAEELAHLILDKASQKIVTVIRELIHDYNLKLEKLCLIGGGGGASTIVPFTAQRINLPFEIVSNNCVFSAIGVALAMVRETIERNIVAPSDDDLLKIRQEAETAILNMGASSDTIEVKIEVIEQRSLVRAIAIGSTEPRLIERMGRSIPVEQRSNVAADVLETNPENLKILANTEYFIAYSVSNIKTRFFGLFQHKMRSVVLLDQYGIVRLTSKQAKILVTDASIDLEALKEFIEDHTFYSDGGEQIPEIYLAIGPRLIDFSGLTNVQQILSVGSLELSKFTPETPVLMFAELKN